MPPVTSALLLLTTTALTTAFLLPSSYQATTTTPSLVAVYNQRPNERSGFGEGGRRKARPPPPKVTQDPEKRISLLNRKLNEVIKVRDIRDRKSKHLSLLPPLATVITSRISFGLPHAITVGRDGLGRFE